VDWQKDGPLSDVLNDIADDGEWLEQECNRNCSITLSRNMWLASQFWLHCSRLMFDETGQQLILSLVYFLLQATPHSELELAPDVDFIAGSDTHDGQQAQRTRSLSQDFLSKGFGLIA
jgi:hypothetical protein